MRWRYLAAALILCFQPAHVQEPLKKKLDDPSKPVPPMQADDFKLLEERDGVRVMLLSKAELRDPGTQLRADAVIAWIKKDADNKPVLDEVYAEGNVVYIQGETNIRCDRLFMYLKSGKGIMINTRQVSMDRQRNMPVLFRADELRQVARGHWIADQGLMSYCMYGIPHFDFISSTVHLNEVAHEDGGKAHLITAQNFMSRILKVPYFYWPFIVFYTDDEIPLRKFKVGQSDRWGWYQEYDLGYKVRKGLVDRLNPFSGNDPADDRKKWGDLTFDIDYRRKRGHGYGANLEYDWNNYEGFIRSYYLRDKGPNSHNEFDRKFIPLEDPDRGRVKQFHRHEISDSLRIETETSYITDRNLMEEFYEVEFKEGKEQETLLYGRWSERNMAATYRERHRINDFQTQVEYLPQIGFHWFSQPILYPLVNNLYFTTSQQLSHLRLVYDENNRYPSTRYWRYDSAGELAAPYDLDLVQILPYATGRMTFYGEDLDKEEEQRVIAGYGLRINSRAERVYDFSMDLLNMNDIRHQIFLEARYSNQPLVSVEPSEFLSLDSVDAQDEFQEISLQIQNALQTKMRRYKPGPREEWVDEVQSFFQFGAEIEFYPHENRDTTVYKVNNFTYPFNPLTLPKSAEPSAPNEYSNLAWNAEFTPRTYISFYVNGEYNLKLRQEEERVMRLTVSPLDDMALSFTRYKFQDITDTLATTVSWKLTEKWNISASQAYDNKTEELTGRTVILTRDLHDFLLQATYTLDKGRDEQTVFVMIQPKFLGQLSGTSELWQQRKKP